jgi:hemoglobin-like flavoprotein
MLTQRQIELIQDTFGTASVRADEVMDHLFQNLFDLDPGLRYLFPQDLGELKRRFGFMLGFLVHRLEEWDEIAPRVRNLGVRHISYGVQVRHYETFGKALIGTLDEILGIGAETEPGKAWADLYSLVSSTMIAGAAATPKAKDSLTTGEPVR